jgi:hypothetical protein
VLLLLLWLLLVKSRSPPVELCKTKKNENWRTIKPNKQKKQTTEFVWVFAMWKIDPFMLHGICRILQMIFAAF